MNNGESMKMTGRLIAHTDRLTLRKLELADVGFIVTLLNTPGWLRFIGDRGVKNVDDAVQYLNNGPFESYEKNGFGLWLVSLREDHQAIGLCGILKRDLLDHPDVGFAFLPECSGLGYATEALSATLDVARDRFGIPIISAITTPDNDLSQKVLRKHGFTFLRSMQNEKGEDLSLFVKHLDAGGIR